MKVIDTTKTLPLVAVAVAAVLALSLASCTDNPVGGEGGFDDPLELTGVRWQSPDSSGSPEQLNPGDLIALEGNNMDAVASVFFNGIEADFNPALASNEYLVVSVPGDLPFGELDPDSEEFNTVRVENRSSEAQLDFPVLPPGPELQEMSNEHAFPGDEVTLYGQFLYLTESVTMPNDVTISADDMEAEPDGSAVTFTVPPSVSTEINGNISITTAAGSDDSAPAFLFHGYRGVILDMLNGGGPAAEPEHGGPQIEQWGWWAAMHPYSGGDVYPTNAQDHLEGAEGDFVIVKQGGGDPVGEGDGAWWGSYRSINLTGDTEWVAPENLDEPAGNFAVKFEMSVEGDWNTGAFQILLNETNYAALVQPWYNEQGSNNAVSYDGWRTYTLPLDEFRSNGGSGGTTNSLEALLGSDGVADIGPPARDENPPAFRFINGDPAEVTGELPGGVSFAVDKVRITRIGGGEGAAE